MPAIHRWRYWIAAEFERVLFQSSWDGCQTWIWLRWWPNSSDHGYFDLQSCIHFHLGTIWHRFDAFQRSHRQCNAWIGYIPSTIPSDSLSSLVLHLDFIILQLPRITFLFIPSLRRLLPPHCKFSIRYCCDETLLQKGITKVQCRTN